jgi:hypothetical protein
VLCERVPLALTQTARMCQLDASSRTVVIYSLVFALEWVASRVSMLKRFGIGPACVSVDLRPQLDRGRLVAFPCTVAPQGHAESSHLTIQLVHGVFVVTSLVETERSC